jgi:hypothetical protein
MFPSIFRSFVWCRFPPRFRSRYIGREFEGVREMRYGRAAICSGLGFASMGWKVALDADFVATSAEFEAVVARNRLRVAARGKAKGRRKVRYILETMDTLDMANDISSYVSPAK